MKNLIYIPLFAVAAMVSACNNNSKSNQADTANDSASATGNTSSTNNNANEKTMPAKQVLGDYLQLKNALAKDNGKDAASAASAMVADFEKVDESGFSADQKKSYAEIAGDAKEMAEHISTNADKLEHQREHFDMLSKDIYDLVKLVGAGQPLYVDYCPMYNGKKGAIWLSEAKEISNPYMGNEMSTCGTVKEELK